MRLLRRIGLRAKVLILFLGIKHPLYAQSSAVDESSIYSTLLMSGACLVVLILGIVLMRGVGKKRQDGLPGEGTLNLMDLKKKGLLTPEEMQKVGESIRRQMDRDQNTRLRASGSFTPDSLLLDPEVRRLQALAEAGKNAENPWAKPESQPDPSQPAIEGQGEADSPDTEENLDDIQLPPEVQQLADAGILSAEEIENVKRRLKARQQSGGAGDTIP